MYIMYGWTARVIQKTNRDRVEATLEMFVLWIFECFGLAAAWQPFRICRWGIFFFITDRVYILYKIQYRIVSPLWPCFSFLALCPRIYIIILLRRYETRENRFWMIMGREKKTVPSGRRYPQQRSKHARVAKTVCTFDIFYASKWYTHYTLSGT